MSINYAVVAKDFATWYSVAAAVVGAFAHKVWSKLVGAEKALAAEIAKLKAEAEAAAKKL